MLVWFLFHNLLRTVDIWPLTPIKGNKITNKRILRIKMKKFNIRLLLFWSLVVQMNAFRVRRILNWIRAKSGSTRFSGDVWRADRIVLWIMRRLNTRNTFTAWSEQFSLFFILILNVVHISTPHELKVHSVFYRFPVSLLLRPFRSFEKYERNSEIQSLLFP